MADFVWVDGARATIAVNGKQLEAAAYGMPPGGAPTIVLLHEGLGCVALWRDFPRALAQATGLGVFTWSRAGYGQSDPVKLPRPLDYMTREAVDFLPGVLDAFGFQEGFLLGHSDGASIAAIYGGCVPDPRLRGLILMAPHFFTEPEGLQSIAETRQAYEAGDLRLKLAKYHQHVDNAFWGWNEAWLDPDFRAWNIADAIDTLRVPVLAIQGADDQYGTLAQIQEIERRIRTRLDIRILPGCRHSPHLERSAETLGAVSTFCAQLLSRPGESGERAL